MTGQRWVPGRAQIEARMRAGFAGRQPVKVAR